MTSTEKLIEALKQLPCCEVRERLILDVKAFRFHDYKSDLPAPKAALYHRLLDGWRGRNGRMLAAQIAERIKAGEFDESKEEADEWFAQLERDAKTDPAAAEMVRLMRALKP